MIEAAKRSFDLIIGGELAAFRLSEAFHDGGQMCRIDGLRLSFGSRQDEHGLRDLVLAARWQPSYRTERPFQKWSWPIICGVQTKMKGNRRLARKR